MKLVGTEIDTSLRITYKSLDLETTKMETIGIIYSLFAELGEKGFCLECNVHGYVCYPLAPNNVPPTNCKC